MRFLIASLFIHILILGFVLISPNVFKMFNKADIARVLPIEIISLDGEIANKAQSLKRKPKRQKTKPYKVLKKIFSKKTLGEGELPSPKLVQTKQQQPGLTQQREVSKATKLSYLQELKLYVEKNKHYPRQAIRLKQSGTVKLKLKITPNGTFNDVRIYDPSPYPLLNQAALQLVKKLKSFRPLPKSITSSDDLTLPISYL